MTAISINKYIYNILINDEVIKGLVADKIFPLVAEEETTFPFIIFRRNSITTEYCKDGRTFDNVEVSISTVANDYTTTVEIMERIRELFELNKKDFVSVHLSSVTEDYIDNAFIQEIVFSIKIK